MLHHDPSPGPVLPSTLDEMNPQQEMNSAETQWGAWMAQTVP